MAATRTPLALRRRVGDTLRRVGGKLSLGALGRREVAGTGKAWAMPQIAAENQTVFILRVL